MDEKLGTEELGKRIEKFRKQIQKNSPVQHGSPNNIDFEIMRETDLGDGALLESEEQYRSLVESTEDSIYLVDRHCRYLFMNNRHLSRLGQKRDEVVGRPYSRFHSKSDTKKFNYKIKEVIRRGISIQQEYKSRIDEKYFLRTLSPVKKPDEGIDSIAVISKDITKRKQAENALKESKEFLRAVFDAIQDGVSVLDPELNIVSVNKTMRNWYAHMLPLEGKKCYHAYHKRDKACEICPTKRAISSGKLEVNEVPFIQDKGVTGAIELFAFPMLDNSGKPTGVVEYVRDITERKRAEEATRENAEKIKLLAYSVSHDIKNPTIAIHILAKTLQERYSGILDEKGKKYCDLIQKASEQLSTLVGQINFYISTKELPINIEKVNLNQVFDDIREEFSDRIISRQLSWVQPEKYLEINVDRLAIVRVLRNFVDNALKYGGEGLSRIEIGYEESSGFHILSVMDDGIGIEEGDSKNIFDLFSRAVASREIDGAGIGLAIANEIAKKHKGEVWAEPCKENGAVFYISISKDIRLAN